MAFDLSEAGKALSPEYWQKWNPEEQARIDADIEKNRKADGVFAAVAPAGAEVAVEQISHDFIFGAHIFNFNQLGTDERNAKYKELYGTLFNSATIAFYWKQFELEENHLRFAGEFRDSAEYWNRTPDPKNELHWRRPAADPVVEFCESKGIRLHGHVLTWGNQHWQHPEWMTAKIPEFYRNQYCTDAENGIKDMDKFFNRYTPAQIEAMLPEYVKELNHRMTERIIDIAMHYKERVHSWDVVNESATDFGKGLHVPDEAVCKSWYGLMPGDYPYRSLKIADAFFPKSVKLNINDYNLSQSYADQVDDLTARGCRIDIIGAQMHLFNPQTCLDIADGKSDEQSPAEVRETMARLASCGKPIHLSEITITAPHNDERGQKIQAVIARNLYRLWFSLEPMMGITWWNVVDDCGAPGEPSVSGLFSRDMQAKPAFFALNDLINNEWKTRLTVKAGADGSVQFRGFRGKYRLTWKDASGQESSAEVHLQ